MTITQGASSQQRIGDQINNVKMQITFRLNPAVYAILGNSLSTNKFVRCLIIRTKYNTGVIPSIGSILQDSGPGVTGISEGSAWTMTPYQLDKISSKDYEVLYDKIWGYEKPFGYAGALGNIIPYFNWGTQLTKTIKLNLGRIQFLQGSTQQMDRPIYVYFNHNIGPPVIVSYPTVELEQIYLNWTDNN